MNNNLNYVPYRVVIHVIIHIKFEHFICTWVKNNHSYNNNLIPDWFIFSINI